MFEGQERIFISNDWITVIFVFVFLIIAFLKYNYNERFSKLFSLAYSDKYYTEYSKTKPLIFNFFHFLLFLVFLLNISLLLYFSNQVFNTTLDTNNFQFFSKIFFGVLIYVFIRLVIDVFLGITFEKVENLNHVTFLKVSNISLISIYLIPLLILINYIAFPVQKFLTTLTLLLLLILIFLRYLSIIKNDQIFFNKLFYFILYLCALEIAPLIVIIKMFVS